MSRRAFPVVRDGEPLTPRHLNLIYRELERWNKASASGGITFNNREGGPHWSVSDGGSSVRPAKAPSGGIDARSGTTPGSAECELYEWDGTDFDVGDGTAVVLNSYESAVAADAFIWVCWWAGAWWVLTEGCP